MRSALAFKTVKFASVPSQCSGDRKGRVGGGNGPAAAGLSSSGSECGDEDLDDDEDEDEENRSDATFTGSELALARDSTLVLQSRRE